MTGKISGITQSQAYTSQIQKARTLRRHGICSAAKLRELGVAFSASADRYDNDAIYGMVVSFPGLKNQFYSTGKGWNWCEISSRSQRYAISFILYNDDLKSRGKCGKLPTKNETAKRLLSHALYGEQGGLLQVIMESTCGAGELFDLSPGELAKRAGNSMLCLIDADRLRKTSLAPNTTAAKEDDDFEASLTDTLEITIFQRQIKLGRIEHVLVPGLLWESVAREIGPEFEERLVGVGDTNASIELQWSFGTLEDGCNPMQTRLLPGIRVPNYFDAIRRIAKSNPKKMFFAHGIRLS